MEAVLAELGIDPAEPNIKTRLRNLQRQWHPDKSSNDTSARAVRMRELLAAYWTRLCDYAESRPVRKACAECTATGICCDLHCSGPCCTQPCVRRRHFALLVYTVDGQLREYKCQAASRSVLPRLRAANFASVAAVLPPHSSFREIPLAAPPDRARANGWGCRFDMLIDDDLTVTLCQ